MLLHLARLITLFFAFAFGAISGSLGVSAEVKSHRDEDHLETLVPAGVTVNIDVGDIQRPGYTVTIASFVVFIVALICFIVVLARTRTGPSHRTLLVQALCLFICALWLLGSVIAYTVTFATRSAHVDALVDGVSIPPEVIDQILREYGIQVEYRRYHSLRLLAIFPWIALMFTLLSVMTLLISSPRVRSPFFQETRLGGEP